MTRTAPQSKSSIDLTSEAYLVMNEIESFLDECRADPGFRDRPELLDRIEDVLTKFYRASDDNPEWQAIWDRVCEILEQKNEALVERCEALVPVLQQIIGTGQIVRKHRRGRVSPKGSV
jgi:hypothetical protein